MAKLKQKTIRDLLAEVAAAADPKKAKLLQGFFKTGKGEYGYGDIFVGLTVPQQRAIAKNYVHLHLRDLDKLLKSKTHEHRLIALIILQAIYQQNKKIADAKLRGQVAKQIADFYLQHTAYINNWDLVDLSAPRIMGDYLFDKPRAILYKLAKSKALWERRIAILSTFWFISKGQFDDSLKIAEILLKDQHALIHKAVGWMLREIGKRSQAAEEQFLKKYYKTMPRTMLRYAIERFPEKLRQQYLAK